MKSNCLQQFLTLLLLISSSSLFSQGGVGINNSGNSPSNSAMLDVVSTNKGVLIPRLQLTDVNDITTVPSAENSLLIFNLASAGIAPNEVEEGFYYWDDSQAKWIKLVAGSLVGTDDQQIDSLILNGTTLTAYLEDGGSSNVDLSSLSDADSDPTNEYNTGANLTGTDLNIIDGGSTQTVDLSPILDSIHKYDEWKDSDTLGGTYSRDFIYATQAQNFGKDVVVTDSGFLGIGTFSPLFKVHLRVDGNSDVTNNSIAMTDANVLGSRTSIGDATSSGTIYSPLFLGQAAGNDIAHTAITSQMDASIDNGTTPLMIFNARLNPSAPVANRPLYQWRNEATPHMTMLPNGNLGLGITSPGERLVIGNHGIVMHNGGNKTIGFNTDFDPSNGWVKQGNGPFHSLIGTDLNPGEKFMYMGISTNNISSTADFFDLIIDTNNNVGIGVTTPTSKLMINDTDGDQNTPIISTISSSAPGAFLSTYLGLAASQGNPIVSAGDQAIIFSNDGNNSTESNDGLVIAPWNINTTGLKIMDNGNVGIGLTSPAEKLHVNGTVRTESGENIPALIMRHSGNGNNWSYSMKGDGITAQNLYLANSLLADTVVTYKTNGNVGIGTTTPVERLTVKNGNIHLDNIVNGWAQMYITGAYDNTSGNGSAELILTDQGTVSGPNTARSTLRNQNGKTHILTVNDNGSLKDIIFTVDHTTTNVGIGTTTPTNTLEVAGDGITYLNNPLGGIRYQNDQSFTLIPKSGSSANGAYINVTGVGNGYVRLSPEGGSPSRFLNVTTTGVGIGTNAPTQNLHVIGNILASGTITPSDKRYKTNIKSLEFALEKVLSMRGVSYQMKKEFKDKGFGDGEQIGVIAQEIERVYPELIITNSDGYKGVDYSKFTPILIQAIKEQQTIIDNQKERINTLESTSASVIEIEDLQSQIDELKALIGSSQK